MNQYDRTFPNFYTNEDCRRMIPVLKGKQKPYIIILFVFLACFVTFVVLTMVLGLDEADKEMWSGTSWKPEKYKADYTGTIICGILAGLFLIAEIISFIYIRKYGIQIASLESQIRINNQYATFLDLGYEKKEAYRLTLEWIDRQQQMLALNNIATANAALGMYIMIK